MKMFNIILSILLLCSSNIILAQYYPQSKVDYIYQQELNKMKGLEQSLKINQAYYKENNSPSPFNKNDISNFIKKRTKSNDYITDTLLIDSDTMINSNIFVINDGVLIIDNALLTLSGHLIATNNGQIIIRNNGHLSFHQLFLNQYVMWLQDSASFSATDATLDGNQLSMNDVNLFDNCTYSAKNTTFLDWTFRKIHNKSTLLLDKVNYVGDMLVRDSCTVNIKNSTFIIPWLQIPYNSNVNTSFPLYNLNTDTVFHFQFNEATPGVNGIGYTFTVDTCKRVMWAVDAEKGCNLTIWNSVVHGYMHDFSGNDTLSFSGLSDSTYYTNLHVPFSDRNCQLNNTFIYSWQLYGEKDAPVLLIDSCSFGELMAKENSVIYASNSTCDGIWLHLGVTDNGFISFSDGLVKSFADTWNRSTLLMTNSEIRAISQWSPPPLGPNYAHSHSYFLSVNSDYDYIPLAFDTAMVMFVYLDKVDTVNADTISNFPIIGSAWLQTGQHNQTIFSHYKLDYQPIDSSEWFFISSNSDTVSNDLLGLWNVNGLASGEYILRLTIWNSNNDSLSALRKVTIINTSTSINQNLSQNEFKIYPNPSSKYITIENLEPYVDNLICVYNINGKILINKSIRNKQGILDVSDLSQGLYFIEIKNHKQRSFAKFIKY